MQQAGESRREVVTAAAPAPAQRLDRFLALRLPRLQPLAPAGADPRRRGDAATARRSRDLGTARQGRARPTTSHVPAPEPAAPRAAGHPARRRLRGRPPHRHRQAEGPGRASRRPAMPRGTLVNALIAHCGRQPLRHRRRQAAGHRAPARQGHHRPAGGRQDRPRAPGPRRAVRRARRRRPARARLPGARLGRAGARRAARSMRALARSTANRTKIAVVAERARPARRHPLRGAGDVRAPRQGQQPVASLLRLVLETGRTHQIRVHLAHIGHPLLGDMTYGAGFKASARKLARRSAGGACRARPPGAACRRARLRAPRDGQAPQPSQSAAAGRTWRELCWPHCARPEARLASSTATRV